MVGSSEFQSETNPDSFFKKNENSQETNLRIFLKRPGQISGRKSKFQDTAVILPQIVLILEKNSQKNRPDTMEVLTLIFGKSRGGQAKR